MEWIDVNERKPTPGEPVLLLTDKGIAKGSLTYCNLSGEQSWEITTIERHGCGCYYCCVDGGEVTHWSEN